MSISLRFTFEIEGTVCRPEERFGRERATTRFIPHLPLATPHSLVTILRRQADSWPETAQVSDWIAACFALAAAPPWVALGQFERRPAARPSATIGSSNREAASGVFLNFVHLICPLSSSELGTGGDAWSAARPPRSQRAGRTCAWGASGTVMFRQPASGRVSGYLENTPREDNAGELRAAAALPGRLPSHVADWG